MTNLAFEQSVKDALNLKFSDMVEKMHFQAINEGLAA